MDTAYVRHQTTHSGKKIMAKIEGNWTGKDVNESPLVALRKQAGLEAVTSGQLEQVASLAIDEQTTAAVYLLNSRVLAQLPQISYQPYVSDVIDLLENLLTHLRNQQ